MTAIENIRLSQQCKDHLIRLKRITGIAHWNVLCRWGFCISLAEPSMPTDIRIPADSNVEMTWRVFGGKHAELYLSLLKMRMLQDGLAIDDETLSKHFRLHLHRGISYVVNRKFSSIDNLVSMAVNAA